MYSQTPAPLYPGQVTVTVRCGHMTRWLSCWCGHRGCAVHLPRLAPENSRVTLSPFPTEALRGWWNMVEGAGAPDSLCARPPTKHRHWNIADPWIRIWTVQIHLYVDSFQKTYSQPSLFLGFALWILSTADWKQYFLEMQKADYMHILCHFI